MEMILKKICIAVALSLLMLACGRPQSDDGSGASTSSDAPFKFMSDMGIDVSRLPTPDSVLEPQGYIARLEPAQLSKLLGKTALLTEDEDFTPSVSLLGGRAYSNGVTMAVYSVEVGESDVILLANYKDGELVDLMNQGTWDFRVPVDGEDGHTLMNQGTWDMPVDFEDGHTLIDEKCRLRFTGDTTFDIERAYVEQNFHFVSEFEVEIESDVWHINKTWSYAIDSDGHFVRNGEKLTTSGKDFEKALDEYALADLGMRPMSEAGRVDALNEVASSRVRGDEVTSDEGYVMMSVLSMIFIQNPRQVLDWMWNNRDGKQDNISVLLKRLYGAGWLDKAALVRYIGAIPDESERAYLERETAQWGPDNAEG